MLHGGLAGRADRAGHFAASLAGLDEVQRRRIVEFESGAAVAQLDGGAKLVARGFGDVNGVDALILQAGQLIAGIEAAEIVVSESRGGWGSPRPRHEKNHRPR